MGLRETTQQLTLSAFVRLGNLARPATYKKLTGNVTRDLVAGTVTPETVDYPLKRVVFAKFEEDDNDKDISTKTDEKMLFPSLSLPVEASNSDIVIDENNRLWEVQKRLNDPASAVVILHVRTSRNSS